MSIILEKLLGPAQLSSACSKNGHSHLIPEIKSNNSIITRIHSGLGNQMFQYAAGLALATHHDAEHLLDISSYEEDKWRSFMLDCFNLSEPKVLVARRIHEMSRKRKRFWRLGCRPSTEPRITIHKDRFLRFDGQLFNAQLPLYLDGYFQSEKYFKSIESSIRSAFAAKESISPQGAERIMAIKQSEAPISVHVRRTDYKQNDRLVLLDSSYYERALELLCSIHGNRGKIFVFSDEIEEAMTILPKLPSPSYEFLTPNTERPWEDIWAMNACPSNIVANSSFSWWGAWLNASPRKRVVAPRIWMKLSLVPERWSLLDLVPEGWILI